MPIRRFASPQNPIPERTFTASSGTLIDQQSDISTTFPVTFHEICYGLFEISIYCDASIPDTGTNADYSANEMRRQ
jgi:hypothetical protein